MDTLRDKQTTLWDYWKDCFGVRPRHFSTDFWYDEAQVDEALKVCDNYLDSMKRTPEGLQSLREDGWMV